MNTTRAHTLISAWFLLALFGLAFGAKGSCRASKKCCDGQNGNCLVQSALIQPSPNEDAEEPCYCDHGCLEMGDCCPDFKDYCGVIDCQVSEWSTWSDCDVACGEGTVLRSREVERPESNGGADCPVLEEKRRCHAQKCVHSNRRNEADNSPAHRETAMILPGKYAVQSMRRGRKYEVRANLKSFMEKPKSKKYCVVFHVDKATHNCQKDKETEALRTGNTLCAVCDDKAQRDDLGGRCMGHGSEGRRTKFKNLIHPRCHGKWTKLDTLEECPCANGPDFVFV
eukprot:maker-scaffold409_size180341-snap-gene-0.28 protein:Tk00890 transcript:maker-scaffold409_size180341-snap-gene-0.28-mRNA-1 annotation:"RPE-spondin"